MNERTICNSVETKNPRVELLWELMKLIEH